MGPALSGKPWAGPAEGWDSLRSGGLTDFTFLRNSLQAGFEFLITLSARHLRGDSVPWTSPLCWVVTRECRQHHSATQALTAGGEHHWRRGSASPAKSTQPARGGAGRRHRAALDWRQWPSPYCRRRSLGQTSSPSSLPDPDYPRQHGCVGWGCSGDEEAVAVAH